MDVKLLQAIYLCSAVGRLMGGHQSAQQRRCLGISSLAKQCEREEEDSGPNGSTACFLG